MKRRPAILDISDHAVLRWLERCHGLNVSAIREHLAGRAMTGAELGATAVRIEGIKMLLTDAGPEESGETQVVMTTVVPVRRRGKSFRRRR